MAAVAWYEYRVSVSQIPSAGADGGNPAYLGIRASDLSQLIMDDAGVEIMDLRPKRIFDKGHIPNARPVPFSELENTLPSMNKEAKIILYCERGPWSRLAYDRMKEMGFKNVRILINGYVGWKWEINGKIEKKG